MKHVRINLTKMSSWKVKGPLLAGVMLLTVACSFPAVTVQLASTATPVSTATATFTPSDTPAPLPSATPTIAATQELNNSSTSSSNCYLGTWELKDISGLMKAVLPTNVQNIQFTGSTGSMTMVFTNDSKMSFKADQFHNTLSANISIIPVTLDVAIDGSGTAGYSVDSSGGLDVTNPDFSGISISATASGIALLSPTKLMDLVPSLKDSLGGAAIATGSRCNGNTLTFDTGIANAPPLTFNKIH